MQKKKAVIGGVAAAAVVVGLGSWWAVDAAVETQTSERGTCGGATWELSAEAEDGGTEVGAELQSAGPGETWGVEIVRDGTEGADARRGRAGASAPPSRSARRRTRTRRRRARTW